MAFNKELEIYENTTTNIGSQEDEIYETINLDQCESVTEGNDTRDKDEPITPPSSIACKNHLQFVLFGLLYAIVFACIFWNIYSEYNGKEKQEIADYINTMYKDGLSELSKNVTDLEKQIKDLKTEKNNLIGMIDNVKKDMEDNVSDLKENADKLAIRLSEQQDIFERKMDVLGETKANKSTVSENTKTMKGVIDNLKKYLENNVTDLKGSDDTLSRRLSEQQNIFERKMDVLGETKANKSTVSEKTKTMMGVIDNLKKYLENNVTDLKGSDDTLSRRLSEQQTIFEIFIIDVLEETKANRSTVSEHTKNLVKMKADIENIKKDQDKSTSKVDDLKGVTDEINTKYEGGFFYLPKKLVDLERQVKDLTRKAEQGVIAFNAMDAVSYTGSDAIKFKKVILNEGDAFNKDTGIFTAPVDGIYQFNAHVCGKIEAEVEYDIKVENIVILTGEFRVTKEGSADTKCTSFSAAALVRKGENVRVGGMAFSKLDRLDNDISSFSGILIQTL